MNARWRLWTWAVVAAVATVLLRLPSLNLLLDRDEGEYASLAWLWRSSAGVPYRDWLEQKPPLAIALNGLAQRLFVDGVLGLRFVSMAWIVATVLALLFLVSRMARNGRLGWHLQRGEKLRAAVAGSVAVAAAVLLSGVRTQSLAANTETWQTLPLLGALALLFTVDADTLTWSRYLAAGVFVGLASLFKQPALAAVFFLPWACQTRDGRLLATVGWTLLGALVPWVCAWSVFNAQGAGADFLRCTIAYNQSYVLQGLVGAAVRAQGLARWLFPELGATAGLALLGWRALGRERVPRRWLAAWLALGLVALAASGRFYPHYAVLLLPPLAVLAGFGTAGLFKGAPGWSSNLLPRVLRLVLVAWALVGYVWCDGALWSRPSAEARTMRMYGVTTFVTAPEAALRLRQICPPDRNLFIWGDEAEVYYLARRRPASRFLFTYPFTGEAPPWPGGNTEMLMGLLDYNTGAAVLAKGLDPGIPLQKDIMDGLNGQYRVESRVSGYILGARKQ